MSFLNPSSDLCPNKQSKKPLNRSKKCPVLIQQTSLNPIHDFMSRQRHPKYRNSGLQRKLLERSIHPRAQLGTNSKLTEDSWFDINRHADPGQL